MIWLTAELRFDAVINVNGKIVATSNIHDVHNAIENKILALGGDNGSKLISCVGKYWCLVNELNWKPPHGNDLTACNYGWFANRASGQCLSPGTQCWQRPGYGHGKSHFDPSQTIRLMRRMATLELPDGTKEDIDLHDVAANAVLAPLVSHAGVLTYLRQAGVEKLEPLPDYTITIKPKPEGLLRKLLEILRLT